MALAKTSRSPSPPNPKGRVMTEEGIASPAVPSLRQFFRTFHVGAREPHQSAPFSSAKPQSRLQAPDRGPLQFLTPNLHDFHPSLLRGQR